MVPANRGSSWSGQPDLPRKLNPKTERGKAYGRITAKAVAVLEVLLWSFHNARSGLCFPSYDRIAEAAGALSRLNDNVGARHAG